MDVRLFIFFLLIVSILAYFIPVNDIEKTTKKQNIPLVIFQKPKMYTLNEKDITRFVKASSAFKYKNKDEIFDANITLKNEDLKKDFKIENLKADLIIKIEDIYELKNNVNYVRDDFISFNTNQMYYNSKDRIVYNFEKFYGNYYEHSVKGENLYLDSKENSLKVQNVHFELQKNKKGK